MVFANVSIMGGKTLKISRYELVITLFLIGHMAIALPRIDRIYTGAEQMQEYMPKLKGKRVGVVSNQSGLIGKTHLVDTLLNKGIDVQKIFSPEHGFRGEADAGEHLKDGKDTKTGLPIVSLYGKHYKPTKEDLKGVEIMIFDIQDVGVRFYTYISTLHYVMEACAENNIPLIVLDRPNPNGFYVDGPVLEEKYKSFVGMHPVPIVYSLTIGEYATMINGEGWLKGGVKCELTLVRCLHYAHDILYDLPVKPSPNLPNATAVYLYPSLALFEGTFVSVGRGTDFPFQVVGHPDLKTGSFVFTPQSKQGATSPKFKGEKCFGYNLQGINVEEQMSNAKLNLTWLLSTYKELGKDEKYFNNYFNSLAGNATLKQQVKEGKTEEEIRASWEPALSEFKKMRKKYVLYDDYDR